MKYIGLILGYLIALGLLALVVWVWVLLIRGTLRRRREREAGRQRTRAAIEKIMADGKITGPKGKYKPMNWARKWVSYSHSLPPPTASSMTMPHAKDIPNYPHPGDDA